VTYLRSSFEFLELTELHFAALPDTLHSSHVSVRVKSSSRDLIYVVILKFTRSQSFYQSWQGAQGSDGMWRWMQSGNLFEYA